MPSFRALADEPLDPHHYAHVACDAEGADGLVGELAEVVRSLYVDEAGLADVLRDAAVGLGEVADDAVIAGYVDRLAASATPPGRVPQAPDAKPRPDHLELSRNELGEVLAHLAATEVYGTVVPASRIRHKETPLQPSRGMDLLGVDDGPLRLVLGEVKTSTEATSPPGVVDDGDDSLRGQLRAYMADDDRVDRALHWAVVHAAPQNKDLVGKALFLHIAGAVEHTLFAVLVRPRALAATGDYGTFRSQPNDFSPGRIRFCIISLDQDIAALARDVYDLARGAA